MQSLSIQVISILIIVINIAGVLPFPASFESNQINLNKNLSSFPVSFPTRTAESINYFNRIAQPDDLAFIHEASRDVLPQIKTGQKMIAFDSWDTAEKVIPTLSKNVDWIVYDPEHWNYTPESEKRELTATVERAANFLHQRNMKFSIVPDQQFVDEFLADLVPNVDMLILQSQHLQDNPKKFSAWVTEKIKIARDANPELLIYIEIGAHLGTPQQMLTAVKSVSDQIDGILIWYMEGNQASFTNLKVFINLLRPKLSLIYILSIWSINRREIIIGLILIIVVGFTAYLFIKRRHRSGVQR